MEYPAEQIDARFKDVVFYIQATHNEVFHLWQDNENFVKQEKAYAVKWDQGSGILINVGTLDSRPVNIACMFHKLDGQLVCFYEPVSQVVDWKMIEEWFRENVRPRVWDKTRPAFTDAANFHHCIQFIKENG